MTNILFILMRTDLNSLNPGKMAAQASHASNAFVNHFQTMMREEAPNQASDKTAALNKAFYEWENSTDQGFGTVLVLGGKWESQIKPALNELAGKYICGPVFDPTYPLVDGEVVHYIPLHTCAYVFVPNKEDDLFARSVLGSMNLHP